MEGSYHFETVRDVTELGELAQDWERLAAPAASPLLDHDWFMAAATAFGEALAPHVVVARRSGRIVAIAPLALVARRGGVRLEIMGMAVLREPSDLLYEDEAALLALLQHLPRLGYPLALERMPAEGAVAKQLSNATKLRGAVLKRATSGSRYVEISGRWKSYMARLSSRRRYDLRRARKRAGGSKQIRTLIHYPREEEVDSMLQLAFAIEASSWKGRRGSALRDDPKMRQFIQNYGKACARRGRLQISFLEIGDTPCAMQIAIEHSDRLWVLKIGYDERYARCSPGIQLMMDVLQDSFQRRLQAFELLGSDEAWVRPWTNATHPYCALILYPLSGRGLRAVTTDTARYVGSRLSRALSTVGDRPHPAARHAQEY